MSATDSASTWSTFLSDLSVSEQTVINSENVFHQAFVQVCTDIRERDPQRLLARFLRYHDQIIAFIGTLDEATGLNTSSCLSSVFWSKAFETVLVGYPCACTSGSVVNVDQTALKTRQKDALLRQYLPALSEVIPAFGADLALFPDNDKIQKPLQKIFAIYMECYEVILQHLVSPSRKDLNFTIARPS